jgi:anti-anti-sigma factor
MSIKTSRLGSTVTLSVGQRLDFNGHQEFRRAYEGQLGVTEYVVDLTETEYIDSSALGMLLLLRESCALGVKVRVVGANPAVKRILTIANLHKLLAVA